MCGDGERGLWEETTLPLIAKHFAQHYYTFCFIVPNPLLVILIAIQLDLSYLTIK